MRKFLPKLHTSSPQVPAVWHKPMEAVTDQVPFAPVLSRVQGLYRMQDVGDFRRLDTEKL